MNNDKVKAIISLMGDDSADVRHMMDTQLKQMTLEELAELSEKSREIDTEISLHIQDVHHELENDFFVNELEQRVANDDLDLEGMVVFLSRFIDRSIKDKDIRTLLNDLTQQCQDYLDQNYEEDRALLLARFLGEVKGFAGNKKQYYAVGNSSIYHLLFSKKGLPITLSVLYIILGKRLGINLQGVAVPTHFIVGHFEDDSVTYYDPFEGGKEISIRDCQILARKAGYPFNEDMLEPVDLRYIFLRMLNNLQYVYSRERKKPQSKAITQLLKIWTERVFRQA